MDNPQLQPQPENGGATEFLRLPDLEIMAGPREIMFEIELPHNSKWNEAEDNRLIVTSSDPHILSIGEALFEPQSMRFMVPVTALRQGIVAVTYELAVFWCDKNGQCDSDERAVVQKVCVEPSRGATVPWVHYRVKAD
jgi:hypothetical protein